MSTGVDPVVGLGQVLAVFVGASTAAVIAPHLVVLIAGVAGSVLGLMSWRSCTFLEGVLYISGMCSLAWLFSGTLSEAMAAYFHVADNRMISPAALVIGWIGHRWSDVAKWAGRVAKSVIEQALESRK